MSTEDEEVRLDRKQMKNAMQITASDLGGEWTDADGSREERQGREEKRNKNKIRWLPELPA